MTPAHQSLLARLLSEQREMILERWLTLQKEKGMRPALDRGDAVLRQQSAQLVDLLQAALVSDDAGGDQGAWRELDTFLERVAKRHAQEGATHEETGAFLVALKRPLMELATDGFAGATPEVLELLWSLTMLLDRLIFTATKVYIAERDAIIRRQRADLAELSTPVLTLWRDLIVMPLVGTLDSRRAQGVMEALLTAIDQHGAAVAILDITGVSTVDTQVAQHLLKTAAAARLMGTDCIITGIGPQIAQTIVELGIDFGDLLTRSSLADAVQTAFAAVGRRVVDKEDPA